MVLLAACESAWAVKSGPLRKTLPDMIVIHATGGPTCNAQGEPIWVRAGELQENLEAIERHPTLGVHYMIDRDGRIVSSVPEDRVAHHVFTFSARSIGIELVNDGDGLDPFPEPQLEALVGLIRGLGRKYGITAGNVKRHSDLDRARLPCAPERRRKVDPGEAFPLERVVRRAFQQP
jgi:N-acetyl-anhydromuramyl-L-alanine amidase AmpD